jgi:hypothetical protein
MDIVTVTAGDPDCGIYAIEEAAAVPIATRVSIPDYP